MQAKMGELCLQTGIVVYFQYAKSVCTYMHNSKNEGDIRIFYLSTTAPYQRYLFSMLELYARYNSWVMDLNMHNNNFPKWHFLCNYTCNSKNTGRIWMFYISNDSFMDVYFLC